MNPYYQIDEQPKKRRTGVIVAIVVAVIAVFVLIPVLMWPMAPGHQVPGQPVPGEEETEAESEAASAPLPDGYEPWLTEPDGGWDWSEPEPEPEPDWMLQKEKVAYYTIEEMEQWRDRLTVRLAEVQRTSGEGNGPFLCGWFDFNMDGCPELVSGGDDLTEQRYWFTVRELTGKNSFVLYAGYDVPQLFVYSEGGYYPCITGYGYGYEVMDDGVRFWEEQRLRFDGSFRAEVVYGMQGIGEEFTFYVGDHSVSEDVYYQADVGFAMKYEEIRPTEMLLFEWDEGMSVEEMADILLGSSQRFAKPGGRVIYE